MAKITITTKDDIGLSENEISDKIEDCVEYETDKNRSIVYDIQGLISIIGVEEKDLCRTDQNPYNKENKE